VSSLSEQQIEKLILKTNSFLSETPLLPPQQLEKEPAYTKRVVLPAVSHWVQSLNTAALHVRGDGGPNPLRIVWDDIALYPDVTIMYFHDRLISFEVKFLRSEDPGGSLTKALGQTLMYEKAGFSASFGIIIDCRKLTSDHSTVSIRDNIYVSKNATAYIYKPSK
jgi:hypothetical protein